MTARWLLLLVLTACGGAGAPAARTPSQRATDSAPAVTALQTGQFADAARQAEAALALDPRNPRAAAVHAIATYQRSMHDYVHAIGAIIDAADDLKFFDHQGGRETWQKMLDALATVDRDLAIAAADPSFSLELCIACWEHDWNHNGRVDDGDRRLFEIEMDGKGGELPAGDPRRRPTFRFDIGDIEWARAMIDFQRALGELVLAYRWSELDRLFERGLGGVADRRLVIHLADKNRVTRARELVLAGLDHADRCRTAYLAETDDDREWVPNPRQHSHAVPLDVDAALYATWAAVTGDVRRMLTSEEGISLRELASAVDRRAALFVPDAYLDLGRMFRDPTDFTIDLTGLDRGVPDQQTIERVLRGLFGNGYQPKMRPSPLVKRLAAMKDQLDRDEDTFDRKLRYLLWLN